MGNRLSLSVVVASERISTISGSGSEQGKNENGKKISIAGQRRDYAPHPMHLRYQGSPRCLANTLASTPKTLAPQRFILATFSGSIQPSAK